MSAACCDLGKVGAEGFPCPSVKGFPLVSVEKLPKMPNYPSCYCCQIQIKFDLIKEGTRGAISGMGISGKSCAAARRNRELSA
jgi:hypothetical protein